MLKLKQFALSFVLSLLSFATIAQESPIGAIAGANAAIIASQYDLIDRANGAYLYANKQRDVFVQVTDLRRASLHNIYEQSSRNANSFIKKPISNWARGSYFSLVNGAFFNIRNNPTAISYPFTPGGSYWGDLYDENRTLCIKGKNALVELTGSGTADYSKFCDFSVTMLHPSYAIDSESAIGRMYIGVPSNNNYVLFFIAKSKKSSQMVEISKLWGISYSKLISGDGSGSSQYYGKKYSLYGSNGIWTDKRKLPHVIITKSR